MDFEWDEEKRLKNIEKHGIDFIDADILFGNLHLVAPGKTVDGKQRWLASMRFMLRLFSPGATLSSA
jgi:uncharacterized DUF497 family protein